MKITKQQLKKLIKEVTENMAGEGEEQPAEEAGPDAGALDSGAAGEQKSDVKTALQYIQKVDNRGEYGQMAQAVIQHGASIPGGKAVLTKLYRALPGLLKGMQEGKLNEDDVQVQPGGNWGQPVPGERQHELVPGSVEDIANSIMDLMAEANLSHNDAVDVLNQIAIEMGLNEPEEEKRPIGFVREALRRRLLEENLKLSLLEESLKRALTDAVKK